MARKLMQAKSKQWFRLNVAETGEGEESRADLYVYDVIDTYWGVAAEEFVKELDRLDVDRVDLWVNSPGGYVDEALGMLNALRRNKARIVAHVDGLAASAASWLIMGADERVMGRNSQLMIHDAWTAIAGDAEALRKEADFLDKTSVNIASIYAEVAGGTADSWRAAMLAETWYSAEEAVEAGLADRVDEAEDSSGAADAWRGLPIFNHAGREDAPAPYMPSRVASALKAPAEPVENKEEMMDRDEFLNALRQQVGIPDGTEGVDEQTVLDALAEALAEGAQEQEPAAPVLPDGVVTIDAEQLNQLRADAEAGRAARDLQVQEARERAVNDAVRTGRIAPARKNHWLAALAADEGAADVLANLEPGLVPLAPLGDTGGVNEATDDDRAYSKVYANTKEG